MKRIGSAAACIALAFAALGAPSARADEASGAVTYSGQIAAIFQSKCADCHRPGQIGPMALLTYEDARPWAKSIKKTVAAREMPPWHADPAHGRWANDMSLSEEEIAAVVKWVDAGAPAGDLTKLPPAREYSDSWQLGKPDLEIELPETKVAAEGKDFLLDHVIKVDIPEGAWLAGVEFLPGDRRVVHHITGYVGNAAMNGPGGTAAAFSPTVKVFVIWGGGAAPLAYPAGVGHKLNRKQTFTFNMHYHPAGVETSDKTRVGLHFGDGPMLKATQNVSAASQSLLIPPGDANYEAKGFYQFGEDSHIVSLFPHMHLRGKDMKYDLETPDGKIETLLNVPRYSFNWQRVYYPEKPIFAPKGSRLHMVAHFDNSAANPENPSPDKWVKTGEQSFDEMGIGFFDFVPAEGIEPKPFKPKEYLAEVLTNHPADEGYVLDFGKGALPAGAAAHIPRAGGKGTLYLNAGFNLFIIDLLDVAWQGNDFACRMIFGDPIPGAGKVTEDGKIAIDFTFPEAMWKEPGAAFGLRMMSHLEGSRPAAGGGGEEKVAAAGNSNN